MLTLFAGSIILISGGIFLLRRGLRGSLLHERPLCATCGYELQGLADDTTLCPECGNDIRHDGGRRVGARRWRHGLLAIGLMFVLTGLTSSGVYLSDAARQVNWLVYKPFGWLLEDARQGGRVNATAAMNELFRRRDAGALSADQIQELISLALTVQGDQTRSWDPLWGDFIERERKRKTLSDSDWKRYASQSIAGACQWRVKTPVEFGQRIPWLLNSAGRIAGNSQLEFQAQFVKFAIEGGDESEVPHRLFLLPDSFSNQRSMLPVMPGPPAPTQPTTMTARAVMEVRIFDNATGAREDSVSPLFESIIEFKSDFDLVPADKINIRLITDPKQRPEFEIKARASSPESDSWILVFSRTNTSSNVPVSAEVEVLSGDSYVGVGRVLLPGFRNGSGCLSVRWDSAEVHLRNTVYPRDGRFKVLLRPNRIAALESMNGIDEIWGDMIEFEVDCGTRDADAPLADALLTEVKDSKEAELTLAYDDLKRRQKLGQLSKEDLQSLISVALQKQADHSIEWNPDWGDMIEQERARGRVSDADWATYARQAVEESVEWKVRSKVEIGETAYATLTRHPARCAKYSRLHYELVEGRTEILGMAPPEDTGSSSTSGNLSFGGGSSGWTLPFTAEELAAGGPRTLTAQVAAQLRVFDAPFSGGPGKRPKPIYESDLLLPSDFDMVAEGEAAIRLITDGNRRPEIEFSLDPEHYMRQPDRLTLQYTPVGLRVSIAADVQIRFEGRVIQLGTITILPGGIADANQNSFRLPDGLTIQGGKADLILTPSVNVAKQTADLDEIWGETIEVKSLKISEATPQE